MLAIYVLIFDWMAVHLCTDSTVATPHENDKAYM